MSWQKGGRLDDPQWVSGALRDAEKRAFILDTLALADRNTIDVFLATMGNLGIYADAFVMLAGASYLEGTLRVPRFGETVSVGFEWDAETDGPLVDAIYETVTHGPKLPTP